MMTAPDRQLLPLRWAIRSDIDQIRDIETLCFEYPWSDADFRNTLRQRNVIAMVIEKPWTCRCGTGGAQGCECVAPLAGFMVYELHKNFIRLLNFAVRYDDRRQGLGRQMVAKLKGKLKDDRRTRIVTELRESNLDAQLFFKAMGFRCTRTLRNWYAETSEDAYEMVYEKGGA